MPKRNLIVSIVLFVILLSSCASPTPAPTTAPTTAPSATLTEPPPLPEVCFVTDPAGIEDNSFNASTWKGIQAAVSKGLVEARYLQNVQEADYAVNIASFISEKCDLIVVTGAAGIDPVILAAASSPETRFLLVSAMTGQTLANVTEISYKMEQAAFLAGYLAAGVAVEQTTAGQTPKVATYGGMAFPNVDGMMRGFAHGAQYYNQKNGTSVEVLGWDDESEPKRIYANTFGDTAITKTLTDKLLDQGAKVVFPVAGGSGAGSADAIMARGGAYFIGVDVDWYTSKPEYASIVLTSVVSYIDPVVEKIVEELADGTLAGGTYYGDLSNNGVGLTDFHDLNSLVSSELKASLESVKADIDSGVVDPSQ